MQTPPAVEGADVGTLQYRLAGTGKATTFSDLPGGQPAFPAHRNAPAAGTLERPFTAWRPNRGGRRSRAPTRGLLPPSPVPFRPVRRVGAGLPAPTGAGVRRHIESSRVARPGTRARQIE